MSRAGTGARFTSADLSYVKQQVAAAQAVPKFVAPGPAFNAAAAKGKTIFLIPETSQVPFLQAIDQSIIKVGKQYGVKVTEYTNQGQSTQWVQGMNQAIAQKASAMILGYHLSCSARNSPRRKPPASRWSYSTCTTGRCRASRHAAAVFAPFTAAAKLEADWAILDTKGKADAVIVTSNEVTPSKYIVKAMQSEFTAHCPTCKTTVIDVPAADWGTKMQSAVQSALVADPNANYVIPLYDSAIQFVLPGVIAAGKSGKVKIASYNGTPFVLTDIKQGKVAMDVGESQDWIGHANMDQALRLITGHPAIANYETPIRIFTKSNIAQAGNPPDPNRAFGSGYVQGYSKLWSGNYGHLRRRGEASATGRCLTSAR